MGSVNLSHPFIPLLPYSPGIVPHGNNLMLTCATLHPSAQNTKTENISTCVPEVLYSDSSRSKTQTTLRAYSNSGPMDMRLNGFRQFICHLIWPRISVIRVLFVAGVSGLCTLPTGTRTQHGVHTGERVLIKSWERMRTAVQLN